MVNEVVQIEVREDGSTAVASKFNTMADAGDRASTSNDALAKVLAQVSSTMTKVGSVVDKLNTSLDRGATSAAKQAQAVAQAATASDRLTTAAVALAEGESEAATRIQAVVSASLAQVAASNAAQSALRGAASASQAVAQGNVAAAQAGAALAQSYTATAGAAVRQIQSVEALNDALNGGIKTIQDWRNVEGQLVAAQQAGILSANEYASMVRQLDATLPKLTASIEKERSSISSLTAAYDPLAAKMAKLEADEQTLNSLRQKGLVTLAQYNKLTSAISAQKLVVQDAQESTDKLNKFGEASAGAKREFGVLIGELARGNFAALQGSAITLTNRMGLLEKAFSATGLAIGIFVGVLAFLGVALVAGYEQQQKLNEALIITGRTSGQTAGSINAYAASLTAAGKSSADNIALLTALVATGRTTSETFTSVGAAASNAMKLTGESVEQVVSDFEPLYRDPIRWATDMDEKWHFLTLETLDHATKLRDTGDAYGAVRLIANEFADNTVNRTKEMVENVGTLEKAWRSVGDYIGRVKQFYADIGKDPTSLQQFSKAKADYLEWQQKVKSAGVDIYDPKNNEALANGTRLWKLMSDSRDKVVGDQAATKAAEAADQTRKANLVAAAGIDSVNDKTQKQINLQNQLTKLKSEYIQLNKTDPTNARLQGVTFGADGPSGGGYASKVAELTTKATPKTPKGRADNSAQRELEALARQEDQFDKLRGTIDPTRGAVDQLTKAQELYTVAVKNGWIEQAQADFEMAAYQQKVQDAINPLDALNRKLDAQVDGFKNIRTVSKAAQETEAARLDLLQKGVALNDEQLQGLNDKYTAIEKGNIQQQLQDKVAKSAMSQTQEQIEQLRTLNQLQEAGALTKKQVGVFEVKQNPDVFAGTDIAQQQQLDQQRQYYDLVDELRKQDLISEQDAARAKQNIDRTVQNVRLQGTLSFLGNLAQMQSSHNRTQAGIGKAAAIAETSINTYKSATAAFSAMAGIPFVGPILGAIAAAAAVASGLAQIQQIRSVNTTGFMTGGYTGDIATNAVAGQVHGKEFVSTAATTARYRPQLEAMHAGTYDPSAGSGKAGPVNVTTPPANVRVMVVDSTDKLRDYIAGPEGEQLVVMHMQNNPDLQGGG